MAVIHHGRERMKRLSYSVAASLLLLLSPTTIVLADDPPATDPPVPAVQTETASPPPTEAPVAEPDPATTDDPPSPPATEPEPATGPQQPTGADATTYTYNEQTGLWENDTYTWDPATNQTKPKTAPEYSYNPATGQWDSVEWVYDAPTGKYIPNTVSVAAPPANAQITPDSSSPSPVLTQTQALNQTATTAQSLDNSPPANTKQSQGIFDLFYNALISNTITSTSHTGDALVAMNTLADNALSGSATAMANIINLLQSSWSMAADSFTTFVSNLFGDVVGDLFLNTGQTASATHHLPDNTTINTTQNGAIDNTIKLEAVSGDATVTQNTQAGDASSGNATAIANLINAINSSVATRQSFVGMLNIFGSLDGDILLPHDLMTNLLASNTLGSLDTSTISNADVLGTFTNNQSITNTINASADSGNSTVTNNTSAGSATTGDARTNVTVLNLTGRQVVGKNALLVFVNVLGKWVGMIVDAPTGSTSAALGSGITENSSLALNSTTNQTITNNLDISATSGDATVADNTSAGSATSGNAKAAVNILNINGSNLSLSDWFGVLFINVFGSWHGSFGINTDAGTIANTPPAQESSISPATVPLNTAEVKAFRFVPTNNGSYTLESSDEGVQALVEAQVLGGSSKSSDHSTDKPATLTTPKQNDWVVSLIGVIIAASLLGTERVLSNRSQKKP